VRDGVWSFSQIVACRRPIQRLFGSGFDLSVYGWRDGSIPFGDTGPVLGCEWARHLKVGDVVTIRLVESNVPDSPDTARAPLSWMELSRSRKLFAYSTRIPDGLAGFLFWMAVAI